MKSKYAKGRRGMDLITGAIMALIIVGVLLILVAQMFGSMKGSAEEKLCFANALTNSQIKAPGGFEVFQLTNCPIINVEVKVKELTKESSYAASYIKKYDTYFTDKNTINYNANKIVAEQMESCWSKLGEGGLSLFDNWDDFFKTNKKCVICSVVRFDQDSINRIAQENNGKTTITSLREWLKNHPVPGKTPKISYFEYFKDPDYEMPDLLFGEFDYDVSKRFAVVFVRATQSKIEDFGKLFFNIGATVINWVGADIEKSKGWSIDTLAVVPYNEEALKAYCNKKMN